MNGQAFSAPVELRKVVLTGNVCINENFKGDEEIASLINTVSEKCGFCEVDTPTDVALCKISYQLSQMEKGSKDCETCKQTMEGEWTYLVMEALHRFVLNSLQG